MAAAGVALVSTTTVSVQYFTILLKKYNTTLYYTILQKYFTILYYTTLYYTTR